MNSDADEAPEKPIRPEADKVLLPNVSEKSSGSKRGAVDCRDEEKDDRANDDAGASSQGHAMSREEGQRTKRVSV